MPLKTGDKNSPKVAIGGVLFDKADGSYQTSKYLKDFLNSIEKQDYANKILLFVDNSDLPDNENSRILKEKYPSAEIIYTGKNIGFGRANNLLIRRARELNVDYFLAANQDMMWENNFVSELVNAMMKNTQAASATGKIMRWDFANRVNSNQGRTNYLDTVGIEMTKEHRFIDRGQGEIDYGQ
ncbi:MAG TPA: glycosyltransferase, partial [bacterium]|nr:glycosyltransferase [bacterium]